MPIHDARRLEVVVDGLLLFGGAQLAVDTMLVSALHCDGSLHRGAADRDGVVLEAARRRRERTYPELVRPGHRAIKHLAKAWARAEPRILQMRAEQVWRLRWCSLLSCAAARAFASSCWNNAVQVEWTGPHRVLLSVL